MRVTFRILTAKAVVAVCALATVPAAADEWAWWDEGWAITAWGGRLSTENTSDIFTGNWSFDNSHAGALAVTKDLASFGGRKESIQAEFQVLRHFGVQRHWEFTAMLAYRWREFAPWDDTLKTTFAIGDGLSIPTEVPRAELKRHGSHSSARLLNSVMMELSFATPAQPDYAFVLRYHHRSGMFRTFSNVGEASTLLGAGIRKEF